MSWGSMFELRFKGTGLQKQFWMHCSQIITAASCFKKPCVLQICICRALAYEWTGHIQEICLLKLVLIIIIWRNSWCNCMDGYSQSWWGLSLEIRMRDLTGFTRQMCVCREEPWTHSTFTPMSIINLYTAFVSVWTLSGLNVPQRKAYWH